MFKESIKRIPAFPENVKRNIVTRFTEISWDESLFMTATLLLYKRVENLKMSSDVFRCNSMVELANTPWASNENEYKFNWFYAPVEKADEIFSDGVKLTQVENFVLATTQKKVKVRTYPDRNTVCIIANKFDVELWHYMISFMSLYFPIFNEKPLTEEEKRFMRSLTLRTSGNYIKILNEMSESNDFRTFIVMRQLEGLEKRFYEARVTNARQLVEDLNRALHDIMDNYKRKYTEYENAQYRLAGITLAADAAAERKELEEYLINNKNLINIKLDGDYISFVVKTYLYPYSSDIWEDLDRQGSIYASWSGQGRDDIRLLLNAIFSENRCLKLKMCGYFKFDYFGSSCNSMMGYDYKKAHQELADYLPNTHLQVHNCLGQNKPDILENLKSGDIISAIECCINCAKRINVHEHLTFRPFVKALIDFPGKCIVTEDGEEMTPRDAIKYLKGEKNENNQQSDPEIADILFS